MNIGVLTSDGVMYLVRTAKEKKDVGGYLSNLLGESEENFNWQVLKMDDAQPFKSVNFRIVED
jgi:hypothetical protein